MSTMKAVKGGARGIKGGTPKNARGMSKALADDMFARQNEYMPGTQVGDALTGVGESHHGIPGKDHIPLPYAMDGPSRAKEKLALKHKMMNTTLAGGAGNVVNYNISDQEMDIIQGWRDMVQHKNFVTWLFKKYDLAKPGMLNFVKEMYPEIIEAQMAYIDQQAKLNSRILKLKAYGPQDKEDHQLEYMLQTGQLTDNRAEQNGYIRGMLNPSRRRPVPPANWWDILPTAPGGVPGVGEAPLGDVDDFFPANLNTLDAGERTLEATNTGANPVFNDLGNNPPAGNLPGFAL